MEGPGGAHAGRGPRLDRAVVRAALEPHDLQEHLRAAAPGRAGAAVAGARGRDLGLQHGRRGPVRAQLRRDVHQLALPPQCFFIDVQYCQVWKRVSS